MKRPRRDSEGTRRASVEFGGKAPRNQTQGGKAKPRRVRAMDHRTVWQRQADRSKRLVRFGAQHKAGLLGWAGIVSALTCMWAFTGATQLLTVGLSVGAAGGGALIRHHQRNRTMNSSTSQRATAAQVKAHHDAMLRTGRPAAPPTASGDTVTVKSHTNDGHGVKTHTRAAPGKGKANGTGGHTVVTYRMRDGREGTTTVTPEQRNALRETGRFIRDHGRPDVRL